MCKPLADVGGAPILDRQLEVLREVFDEIAIAASNAAPFAGYGLPVIPDAVDGAGPLGGLAAALAWCPQPRLFAVAGDMPFLSPAVIERLLAIDGRLVVPVVGGRPHPLHAVYARDLAATVRQRLAAGRRALRDLLDLPGAVAVDADDLRALDPELRCLVNVNTATDLQMARASVQS